MPVRDSRNFGDFDARPDLEKGVTILFPADRIMAEGRRTWQDEGFWDRITPYHGADTPVIAGTTDGVPFRRLDTDLAFSLDIREIKLEKAGHNALLPPHALVDAALLPVFAAGALTTGGHLDLGARVFSSTRVRMTAQVDLDAVSRMGDGLVLEKSYIIHVVEPAVSEQELYPSFTVTPEDGQEFGSARAHGCGSGGFPMDRPGPRTAVTPSVRAGCLLETGYGRTHGFTGTKVNSD